MLSNNCLFVACTSNSFFHIFVSADDLDSDLVRHYLIEPLYSPTNGVRIKGFGVEPVFPSLEVLIHQHTQQLLALPCTLRLPQLPSHTPMGPAVPEFSVAGDSDSQTVALMDVTENSRANGESIVQTSNGQLLSKPMPSRASITSPLSPTAGLFASSLTSPPPSFCELQLQ